MTIFAPNVIALYSYILPNVPKNVKTLKNLLFYTRECLGLTQMFCSFKHRHGNRQ